MKKIFVALIFSAFVSLLSANVQAYTIADNYWGGTPTHSWSARDVIGDSNYYGITGMDVDFSGSSLTVAIYSSFFDQIDSKKIWDDRTKMGDLFIATGGWAPVGSAADHYQSDTMYTTGTDWNYVVVFDHHGPTVNGDTTSSGTVALYRTTDGTMVESNLNGLSASSWVYRDDQLVQFIPGNNATPLATGTWAITDISGTIYDRLLLSFNASELYDNSSNDNWGFHWTMSCGNDVIEGEAPVPNPEPSTFLLTGLGLLGAVYLKRKKMR